MSLSPVLLLPLPLSLSLSLSLPVCLSFSFSGYDFREFFKRRDNKHPSWTPTCEPLKRLGYSPEIPSHIHKKKKKK